MIERSTRTVIARALLALTLAYVLVLQGLFTGAAASMQIASARSVPSMMQILCSGAQAPDAATPIDNGHLGTAPSSCCTWGTALALDPIVPPIAPAVPFPYYDPSGHPVGFGQVTQVAILFRVATAQGSRAPPDLAA